MSDATTHHEELALLLGTSVTATSAGTVMAMPSSAAEAAELLRYAKEHRLPVRIDGGGTKASWCGALSPAVVLSTAALHGVREHVWQDLTATVGAGTSWSDLQRSLAAHGQCVALDPLWPEAATVGGIVATNDSGALRTRYGSLRDLIIGMTVVLADGTVAKTGGKVVKNVAGYDLHKLMTGAFGTLGLITEVTFRLHPVPKHSATWSIISTDLAALDRARYALSDSTLPIEALQLRTDVRAFAIDLKLVFLAERVESVERQLRSLISPLDPVSSGETVWMRREELFCAEYATAKVTLLATAVASFTADISAAGGRSVAQGSGVLTACLPAHPGLLLELREKAEEAGGSLTILSWPASIPGKPATWGRIGDSFPLMREIKRRFDPDGILNPGRFLEGLEA